MQWPYFIVGLVTGRYLPELIVWYWRRTRAAQAAHKPEHADGEWFADTTPPPPVSQAQRADAVILNKISLRSRPGRRAVRRNGR
jgi:hypothetical protein